MNWCQKKINEKAKTSQFLVLNDQDKVYYLRVSGFGLVF